MVVDTVLFLTADEKKLFDSLPAGLKEGWTVKDENQNGYESPEILQMRAQMSSFHNDTAIVAFMKRLEKNSDIQELPKLSKPAMVEFFFTIGAQGMAAFIDQLLRETKTDDDVRGLAYLTSMRHRMLEINSSVTSAK